MKNKAAEMCVAVTLSVIAIVIISLLVNLAVQFLYQNTKAKEDLDRYRKYYHLRNNPDSGDEYISD